MHLASSLTLRRVNIMDNEIVESILVELFRRYSVCKEYRNQGTLSLRTIYEEPDGFVKAAQQATWQISFVRDEELKFDFSLLDGSHDLGFTITSQQDGFRIHRKLAQRESLEKSLKEVVNKTTGLSFGLTPLLFSLLLPDHIAGRGLSKGLPLLATSRSADGIVLQLGTSTDAVSILLFDNPISIQRHTDRRWADSRCIREATARLEAIEFVPPGRILVKETEISFDYVTF